MKATGIHSVLGAAILLPALLGVTGCNSIPKRERIAVPQELVEQAVIPGIPHARSWGDQLSPLTRELLEYSKEEFARKHPEMMNKKHVFLGISGGGANGAYAAGLLTGWSERGDRPKFSVVSGISTGAIISPFVFLGEEYDPVIIELYTTMSTEDVVIERNRLSAIRRDAFFDTEPLRQILLDRLGDREIERIAQEYRNGRRLLIGTVNIDVMRPVSWNIGEIAASQRSDRRELIVDIIMASAAIPVGMPPVFFDVEVDGRTYQEMHVDGGIYSQVMTSPITIRWNEIMDKLNAQGTPQLYVIRNAKIVPPWKEVQPKMFDIASRSLASMIRTQGLGDLKTLYLTARRDGVEVFLTCIPDSFDEHPDDLFDSDYMNALFDVGYEAILHGDPWVKKLD